MARSRRQKFLRNRRRHAPPPPPANFPPQPEAAVAPAQEVAAVPVDAPVQVVAAPVAMPGMMVVENITAPAPPPRPHIIIVRRRRPPVLADSLPIFHIPLSPLGRATVARWERERVTGIPEYDVTPRIRIGDKKRSDAAKEKVRVRLFINTADYVDGEKKSCHLYL